MKALLSAFALALALEGAAYALFPEGMKRMLGTMREIPAARLRLGGLAAIILGVALAWIVLG